MRPCITADFKGGRRCCHESSRLLNPLTIGDPVTDQHTVINTKRAVSFGDGGASASAIRVDDRVFQGDIRVVNHGKSGIRAAQISVIAAVDMDDRIVNIQCSRTMDTYAAVQAAIGYDLTMLQSPAGKVAGIHVFTARQFVIDLAIAYIKCRFGICRSGEEACWRRSPRSKRHRSRTFWSTRTARTAHQTEIHYRRSNLFALRQNLADSIYFIHSIVPHLCSVLLILP